MPAPPTPTPAQLRELHAKAHAYDELVDALSAAEDRAERLEAELAARGAIPQPPPPKPDHELRTWPAIAGALAFCLHGYLQNQLNGARLADDDHKTVLMERRGRAYEALDAHQRLRLREHYAVHLHGASPV